MKVSVPSGLVPFLAEYEAVFACKPPQSILRSMLGELWDTWNGHNQIIETCLGIIIRIAMKKILK